MSAMTPKTQQRFKPRKRSTRWCQLKDCNSPTKHDKPFCRGHVENHDYVRDLLARIEHREAEESRVLRRGWKAVDIEGGVAQDTLQYLRIHGEQTVVRLAQNLNRNSKIQASYVEALFRAGFLKVGQTVRGNQKVKIA